MTSGIGVLDAHQSAFPAGWEYRCIRSDALRVIAELLVKFRAFSDGAIHLVRQRGTALRIETALHRSQERGWSIGKLAEDRLAAEDHQLALARGPAGRADQVLKL